MAGIKLQTQITEITGIGPRFYKLIARLGIKTVRDLVFHFPVRYEDFSRIYKISDLEPGQYATVQGTVKDIDVRRSWRKGIVVVEAFIEDESGEIRAIWFNQPYVLNSLRPGRTAA